MNRHPSSLFRVAIIASLCAGSIAPAVSHAAVVNGEVGVSSLQAQLPAGTPLPQASYEQLTHALSLATSGHRHDATAILTAAITRKIRQGARLVDAKPPCIWVARLLRASLVAAPEMASSLLEVANSLCPDCADELQATAERLDGKNVVDDKNGPVASAPATANDPAHSQSNELPAIDGLNVDDPGTRNVGLFAGGGFGPGFPGSPGFVGSAPGGGIALPPPASLPVTAVMND